MRATRFNIMDVTLHTDAIHRGGGQVSSLAFIVVARIFSLTCPFFAPSSSLPADVSSTPRLSLPTPDCKSPST
jgi:hypothetical protein